MELINPTHIATNSDGTRWYAYDPRSISPEVDLVTIRREMGSVEDQFDCRIYEDHVDVRWTYRSTYGNVTGKVPEMTQGDEAEVLAALDLAMATL